ncbi:hypothetical protein D3C84_1065440 [compost metagenome]
MHAGLVIGLLDGRQGQRQGFVGNQLVLLRHGIDRQRQEVQQLGIAESAEAQRTVFQREVVQRVEHALKQDVGRSHQRFGKMPYTLK